MTNKYNLDMEKVLKNTKPLDLDKMIMEGLKTEEDIKEWLAISIEEYLEDNDFNALYRSIEIVTKAKKTLFTTYKETVNVAVCCS
jgi:uncharacterized ferredoxin-like protein